MYEYITPHSDRASHKSLAGHLMAIATGDPAHVTDRRGSQARSLFFHR
jgi:hypothetical protein